MTSFPTNIDRHISPEPNTGCWLWEGSGAHGYGQTWYQGRLVRAHRATYEIARGPIPRGLVLDHLCRVRACVNPDHLEAVTQRENLRRGHGVGGQNRGRRKEFCKRGHLRSGDNVITTTTGHLACRLCRAITNKRYWAAK